MIRSMQISLDKLITWESRWDTDLNVNNCGLMYIGKDFLVSIPDE